MLRALLCILAPFAVNIASAAPLTFPDSTGAKQTPLATTDRKATVLIFLMHDCPVANASAPELTRIAADFAPRGVKFFGVYATETAQEITTHRKEYKLPFPGLLDAKCLLARHAGATRVPEVAVFSAGGELIYRGRIDDRATQPGIMKPTASRHDLRATLEAALAGKKPEPRFTKAIGCYLPL